MWQHWRRTWTMAELLMRSDRGSSFFWTCCALNGFSNRGFTSISSFAKQRHSPTGIPDESDGWMSGSLRPYNSAPWVSSDCWIVELYKAKTFGGWWQNKRSIKIMNRKMRNRQHRSFTETEFKTKIKVDVERAKKGVFYLSISITKPFGLWQPSKTSGKS